MSDDQFYDSEEEKENSSSDANVATLASDEEFSFSSSES